MVILRERARHHLGVSRTPVRKALAGLRDIGLRDDRLVETVVSSEPSSPDG